MEDEFKAFVVREQNDGSVTRSIESKGITDLPEGDVLIQVKYAGLNYKDALSANGHKGITKSYPHTPGVDASGIVAQTNTTEFAVGDEVMVTGYDLGMNTSGGFQEYIRVPNNWVVKKPKVLDLKETMILGTAGLTAALSLYKMELMGQNPKMGDVLVTGATGGVGSMAVGILSAAGYDVIASTGSDQKEHLRSLGAKRIENRSFANDTSGRPLLRSQWAGAVDTIGGNTLATCVKACKRSGSIAACGLVASHELELTVYPFLLNGINILGVDSAETPMALRQNLWDKLSGEWKIESLTKYSTEISLEQLEEHLQLILQGKTIGRVVVAF
jgi:acrylyl-CoA reductase (NADPH)